MKKVKCINAKNDPQNILTEFMIYPVVRELETGYEIKVCGISEIYGKYRFEIINEIKQEKGFFMVWIEGNNQPKTKHNSIDEATAEAERLILKTNSKKAFVLQAIQQIEVETVKVTELFY